MNLLQNCRGSRLPALGLLIVAGTLMTGCAAMTQRQAEQERAGQQLQAALTKQTAENQELEGKLAGLQLLLLEKDAKNKDLDRRLTEAILEVVRTKAKLRSVESKAEAVSTLAEGEIALKTLKANLPGVEKDADFSHAEDLLKASGLELKKENYGGALYLAIQAKSLINEGQEQSTGRKKTSMLRGEVLFATPVPLRLVSQSKIREGPGLDSKVLFTLQQGAELVGHSYKGLWVRVSSEDSRGGWVYYSLIAGR
ncbi:MAG: SH3 domain-containing protein [Nitrospirota bacterium]